MALKATDIPAASPQIDAAGRPIPSRPANAAANSTPNLAINPEEQELARKREEQAAIESALAERELRSANLRAELGAFERQYLHHVGSRYAELDELKAARPRPKPKRRPVKRPKPRRALSNLRRK